MSDSESGSDAGVPHQEPPSPSTTPEVGTSRPSIKRKRAAESEEPDVDSAGEKDSDADVPAATESKRQKKKKKQKSKKDVVRDEALDEKLGVNHAIAHMDGQLLADHVAQRMKRFEGETLSGVEQEDLRVSATAIKDSSSWSIARTMEHFPRFLEEYSKPRRGTGKQSKKKLSHAYEENGHPHTLIIAASGIRAADVTRACRPFQTKHSFIAKLFAKHIKLKEAIETVQNTRMGIGVGTPQRVNDLLEAGVLKTDKLERIVIDASYIDSKKRGILDMRETVAPLVKLLNRPELKERYDRKVLDEKIELIFF